MNLQHPKHLHQKPTSPLNQTSMQTTTFNKIHTHSSPLLTPKKLSKSKQPVHLPITEPHLTYFITHLVSTTSLPRSTKENTLNKTKAKLESKYCKTIGPPDSKVKSIRYPSSQAIEKDTKISHTNLQLDTTMRIFLE